VSTAAQPSSIDLSNYVADLQREVYDPNSTTNFANLQESDWVGHLADAFWEARLDGLLQGYICSDDGIITPLTTSGAPAGAWTSNPQAQNWSADYQWREMVQLVILYASFRIIRNALRGLRTAFAASAGAVRYEYQQSASMLTTIMQDVMNRRNMLLARLSDLGTTQVTMIDSIIARDQSLMQGMTYWVGAGDMIPGAYGAFGYDEPA
jgi:hypothetical protein